MKIKFQKETLEKAVWDFYRVTGIRLAVLDSNFTHLVSLPSTKSTFCSVLQGIDSDERCHRSDTEILDKCAQTGLPQMHICHAGLIDIALPILHNDTTMGYIIMGQMRRDIPFESITERLSWASGNITELKKAYQCTVIYDDSRVESLANLAAMLASYIMAESMISEEHNQLTEKATAYIRAHIHESISINDICRGINTSKNTLYRNIRGSLGVSINEYITDERIRLAKKLLKEGKDSVSSISEQVGISNSSYFCKLFKEKTGITPLKYRRLN